MKYGMYIFMVSVLIMGQATDAEAGGTLVSIEAMESGANELGQVPGVFRFTRSSSNGTLVINATVGGTAVTDDFSFSDGGTLIVFNTVTLGDGVSMRDIIVTPNLDNLVEGQERFDITLQSGSGYAINGPATASVFVEDDPPIVTMEAIDDSAAEAGQDPMVFRFSRTGGNVAQVLEVNVEIEDSSTADLLGGAFDLTGDDGGTLPVFGTFSITAGLESRDLAYTPNLDNLVEPTEQLDLSLNPGSYVVGTPSSGSGTLTDDPPVVSVSVVEEVAAEAGPPGILSFDRSGGNTGQALMVNAMYSPSSTVTIGTDFTTNDGGTLQVFETVTINAGQMSREIEFTAVLDSNEEGEETLIVDLLGGNYLLGVPGSATLIFTDDRMFSDGFEAVQARFKSCSVSEKGSPPTRKFYSIGAQTLDVENALVWLRCGPAQEYDWLKDTCTGPLHAFRAPQTWVLAQFNAGLLGNNEGIGQWRLASESETATAGFSGSCFVR